MKVIVTKKSFYGNKINKEGEIITIKGNKLPSWAKKVEDDKKEQKSDSNNQKELDNVDKKIKMMI